MKYETLLKQRGQVRYNTSGLPSNDSKQNDVGYPGQHHWLELDNNPSLDLINEFSKEKIIWPDIANEPSFFLDNEKYFVTNTAYIMTGPNLENIIVFLNSKLNKWYFSKIASSLGDKTFRYTRQFVENIPLPNFNFNKIEDLYLKYDFSDDEINFIEHSE